MKISHTFRLWQRLLLLATLGLALSSPLALHAQEEASAQAKAGKAAVTLPPSNYKPVSGAPFFLLSDASYGSNETALVRFEPTDTSAVQEYGGVDIRIYKVPRPLEFLQAQKNLHRIDVRPQYGSEGLSNTLTYLFDSWVKKSRMAWQGLFSSASRQAVVKEAPQLATAPGYGGASKFSNSVQFKALPGYELLDQFRYPVLQAKPIAPPADLKLDGSSTNFIKPMEGNVMIPLGKRAPGLYLVEGIVGGHRALTMVFVSDTVAITKVAAQQMLVWTARRSTGAAVPGTQIKWTDGSGVLQSGATDQRGVANFERASPEQTWIYGMDAQGGVFISENFYYDSEIYNSKLYMVTDRPLYRAGDNVFVKMLGRQFTSSLASSNLPGGEVELQVRDPNGLTIMTQKTGLSPQEGADTSFRLPENAAVGGYELRAKFLDQTYLAAFRVAQYQKPHFDIALVQDKSAYKTGEVIKGKLQLRYPDGKPVAKADVQITVRAQRLTMNDGELGYSGQFPLKLASELYSSDGKGVVEFELPAAKDPSRYVLTAFATDGAAYRVKLSKELLIERANNAYALRAGEQISQVNAKVVFKMSAQGPIVGGNAQKAASWEALKLENRKKYEGKLNGGEQFEVSFPESGSYMLTVRDGEGNILAAASHWVAGDGMQAVPGGLEIVFNKELYNPGETATALITFPEEVQQALLTLERDKVENLALLNQGESWVKMKKIAARQWQAEIPVAAQHGPNITFSVAYVKNGQYMFENRGMRVVLPKIDIQVKPGKEVYAPGEKVTLDIFASEGGKPVAATVALGVVDEMIYVLQPEIAPNIFDFFYHPRRNNVRTSASLSFVTYDLAASKQGDVPRRGQVNERGVKMLERPRRDEVDTAFWQPSLKTDATGRASVSFIMPDALTRWRVTARAMSAEGLVGQKNAWLRSEKSFYVKWTSPNWMRNGDAPQAAVALFNQTQSEQKVEFAANGAGIDKNEQVNLKPGINFVTLPLQSMNQSKPLLLAIKHQGKVVDSLQTPFNMIPNAWRNPRSLSVDLSNGEAALSLPPDAANLQVQLMNNAQAQFARVMDDLIAYPYGCVEQTASRMIPLALALQQGAGERSRLLQILHTQRLRLSQMAGQGAVFGWWGDTTKGDPLLTTYAYYADWRAAQVLKINLPDEHWQRLPKLYADKSSDQLPVLHKAMMLWMMKEIGLPVDGLAVALADKIEPGNRSAPYSHSSSLLLAEPDAQEAQIMARALLARVAPAVQVSPAQWDVLRKSSYPAAQALLLLAKQIPQENSEKLLAGISAESPTMDRALSLIWIQQALGGAGKAQLNGKLLGAWQSRQTVSGITQYYLPPGTPLPATLKSDTQGKGLLAQVQFDSAAPENHSLPVKLTRRLYRLEKQAPESAEKDKKTGKTQARDPASSSEFQLVLLKPGTVLKTDELYMDEISITPDSNFTGRYALLEVPLPPGADVEASTWGVYLQGQGKDNKEVQPLERARHQINASGYAVPLESLQGREVVRHLLRFSQVGKYNLPSARVFRMYQPEKKAFESGERGWAKVEVQ